MKNSNLGKKYEYEFLDKRFLGYKQKIVIDEINTKKAKVAKAYWNHLESRLDNSNNREYVDKTLTNFANAMRRFSPFYSYNNVNIAFENTTRELIDRKVEYLEFNKKKRKNKKLSNLIKNSMVSCTEQNCFFLSFDKENNWDLYNSLDKSGNKKSHTVLGRDFGDFYGVIDITLGWKKQEKEKNIEEHYGNVYTINKDDFEKQYALSTLKKNKILKYRQTFKNKNPIQKMRKNILKKNKKQT